MEKLTKSELERLQGLQESFTRAKIALGDLEMQKFQVHQEAGVLREQFNQEEKKLVEKYGKDSVIDMRTGSITKKEDGED